MNNLVIKQMRIGFLVSLVLLVTACATKLAPEYDKAIVDGLISVNQAIMEQMAVSSQGTKAENFSERKKSYNNIIGRLDALVLQIKARPIPENKATEKVNAYLTSRGLNGLSDDESPSATALAKVSETLSKMRNTDRKQGITAFEVRAFRGQVVIYLDQALTYESFLQR